MKITGLETHLVRLPGAPTLADIPDKADQYTFVTLQLRTDEGIEGIGLTFFGASAMPRRSISASANGPAGRRTIR